MFLSNHNETVRSIASKTGCSKMTAYNDLTQNLKNIDLTLYRRVLEKLEFNKSVKHLRGGMSTKRKSEERRNENK